MRYFSRHNQPSFLRQRHFAIHLPSLRIIKLNELPDIPNCPLAVPESHHAATVWSFGNFSTLISYAATIMPGASNPLGAMHQHRLPGRIGGDIQKLTYLIPPGQPPSGTGKRTTSMPCNLQISQLIRKRRPRDFILIHQRDHRFHMRLPHRQIELMNGANAVTIEAPPP